MSLYPTEYPKSFCADVVVWYVFVYSASGIVVFRYNLKHYIMDFTFFWISDLYYVSSYICFEMTQIFTISCAIYGYISSLIVGEMKCTCISVCSDCSTDSCAVSCHRYIRILFAEEIDRGLESHEFLVEGFFVLDSGADPHHISQCTKQQHTQNPHDDDRYE